MRALALVGTEMHKVNLQITWFEVAIVLPIARKPVLFKGPSGVAGDHGMFFMSGWYDSELDDDSTGPVFRDTTGQRIKEFRPTHWAYLEGFDS